MSISPEASSKVTHPLYATWAPTWQQLYDIYEGAGGFLDPNRPYLIAHPREWLDHSLPGPTGEDGTAIGMVPNPSPSKPSPKLLRRRELARYENIAATILDVVMASLFATAPTRTVGQPGAEKTTATLIEQFWMDVDGKRTSVDDYLQHSWIPAAGFGHTILLMEKADTEATTAADAKKPRLCRYTPLDLIDWLTDDEGKLLAVKLIEPEPRLAFELPKLNQFRVRVVDEKSWTLYDSTGTKLDGAEHGFGRLPVVVLYGKRRALTPFIGKSVLGDPMLYIDAYNLVSEERELLRNQTFAILNVPLGKEGTVAEEQARLGSQSGTANVMFSGEKADFISPDGANVNAYQQTQDRLGRMIYRLASVPWEGDSRAAESAESRRVKREEMTATLKKYASEVQKADAEITELVYRAVHGDGWEAALKTDQVVTAYPDTFDPPDMNLVVQTVGLALGLDLGDTATKNLKKQTVRQLMPDTSQVDLKVIDDEIDSQEILTADEKQQQLLDASASRMAGRPFGRTAA